MTTVLVIQILACVLTVTALRMTDFLRSMRRRGQAQRHLLTEAYMQTLWLALQPGASLSRIDFPRMNTRASRMLLAGLVHSLAQSVYGNELTKLAEIIQKENIDRFLLRRAAHSYGARRAASLELLTDLPLSPETLHEMLLYLGNHDRRVRFIALKCAVCHDPDQVTVIMNDYPFPLSTFELTELALLLRSKSAPVDAARELLQSSRPSGIRLGLILSRLLQIKEVRNEVVRHCINTSPEISRSALMTLPSLHTPVDDRPVLRAVSGMTESMRRKFYRRLVTEGYSLKSLDKFLQLEQDNFLCEYLQRLVISRKRLLRKQGSMYEPTQ